MKMHQLRVALAEDKKVLQQDICGRLEDFKNIEIVFIANNGQELLDEINKHGKIDAVLMDIEMPIKNGIAATTELVSTNPGIKVVMLTVFDDDNKIFEAIMAGASGYLLKEEPGDKIAEALEMVATGGAMMSAGIAIKALRLIRAPQQENLKSEDAPKTNLTAREIEILEQLANGLDYKTIATNLFIEKGTVKKHIEHVYRKLDVHNKVAAVNKAKDQRII